MTIYNDIFSFIPSATVTDGASYEKLYLKGLQLLVRIGWFEFNVPFKHKYGYIRDDAISENDLEGTGSNRK